ncbi:MAG TPA: hypothetical protein VKW08_19860 [Xanthobacteraceae bacterium]|nr:hypothetical protein [Xanthobacteraceae bacterium]
MLCCKVPGIKESDLSPGEHDIKKPPGVWCRHAVKGSGCAVYADRPSVCRRFYCHWMLTPGLGPEWKPDKARFVLYGDPTARKVIDIAVDPAFPNAWMKPPYRETIMRWAAAAAADNCFVLIQIGQRNLAVVTDRVIDLGTMGPEDVVTVARGPEGLVVKVISPPKIGSTTNARPD